MTVCCRACSFNPETTLGGNYSLSNLQLSLPPWKSSGLKAKKAAGDVGGFGGGLILSQWSVCSSLMSTVLLPFAGSELSFTVVEFIHVFLFFSKTFISKENKISYSGSI